MEEKLHFNSNFIFNPTHFNILIVEDSTSINKILTNELQELQYNCFSAFNLQEAKSILEEQIIDYLLLDINLPDGNGSELIIQLENSHTKIFVLTAQKDANFRKESYQKGVIDFIIKDKDFFHKIEGITKSIEQLEKNRFSKILIVDDSKIIQEQLQDILGNRNYQTLITDNAQTAYEITQQENIHLILLDIELKNSNGLDFLHEHNVELITRKKLPIIIISGLINSALIRDGLKAGAVDIIKKPYVIEEIVLKVDLWIDYNRKNMEIENSTKLLAQYKETVDRASIVSKTDDQGTIIYINEQFCKTTGYNKEELIGKKHNLLRNKDTKDDTFKELWETIQVKKRPWQGKLKNRKKDGSSFWINIIINPILDANNEVIEYIAISNDITENILVEDYFKNQLNTSNQNLVYAMQKAKEYKRAMYESNLVSRTNLKGEITFVNDKFCEISGYSREELMGHPHNIIRHPDMSKDIFIDLWRTIQNGLTWQGIIKNQNKSGQAYWVNSTIVPIKDKNENIIEYMAIRSDLTELFELHAEIEETQKEIIYRMGEIGETRSNETGNHVKRVALYSKLLAELYGLEDEDIDLLFTASPMHDIGKVGIPDAILKKPSSLTQEEFQIMKTHAQAGYNILKCSKRKVLKAAAIVAMQHHEKWNGKGYPQGLKEDEIHIYGRITSIADVFDALGSDRCYKKAWKNQDIFDYLKDEREQSFDPELIDLFLENKEDFIAIRDKFKD